MQPNLLFSLMSIFLVFEFFGVIFGITGTLCSLYALIRMIINKKKNRINPKNMGMKIISVFIVSVIMIGNGLFWLISYPVFKNDYPTLSLAVINEGLNNVCRVDTEVSTVPILLAEGRDDNFVVFTYTTEKTPFGFKKYFINCTIYYIYNPWFPSEKYEIDETEVNDIEYFPDIWFGIIYPDKCDKIKINGKIPSFYNVQFHGTEYVFWYIEKDGEEVVLSFE